MIKYTLTLVLSISFAVISIGQTDLQQQLNALEQDKLEIGKQLVVVDSKIENVKLKQIHELLVENGFPTDGDIIHHEALSLEYSEELEQAKWVAHVISGDIIEGSVTRTNDFRTDELVKTGTAEEIDYFIKTKNSSGKFDYDGFGYDRGHLAPSADFRWSAKALSESYFYSNMSPQLPGFNREKWADLENNMRGYIFRNPESNLLVVTGPIFDGDEVKILERSKNKVAIPTRFFKVAYDPILNKAVGFILPHEEGIENPAEMFAVPVDSVEKVTGFNFFSKANNEICEATFDLKDWFSEIAKGDVVPIHVKDLPRNHFNTVTAKLYMDDGSKVKVVGTVVSTRKSRKGNILVNLDKQFPNHVFTLFIKKDRIPNFEYDPVEYLKGKTITIYGKISNLGGTPTMYLDSGKQIEDFQIGE